MSKKTIFPDSFSGSAADLPKSKRDSAHVLECLKKSPRISTFDFSEHMWLWDIVQRLEKAGKIREVETEAYPWHRFVVIEAPAPKQPEQQ